MFDNHLKPNGLYVIEDWFTGYWSDWPDGKRLNLESYTQQKFKRRPLWLSWLWAMARLGLKFPMRGHRYGMVGFIKQLIDEQAAHDVTRGRWKGKPTRSSKFQYIIVTGSIVVIKKALQQDDFEPRDLAL